MKEIIAGIALAGIVPALLGASPVRADSPRENPVRLQIVGGLAGVTQYTKLEQPFWQSEIEARSGGRVTATIRPLDAGGLRGQEMLQLLRLGVVPLGTATLSLVAGDDPELNAVDLPALNPDMATLRRTLAQFRPHLTALLRERYEIELLGVYAYPAQVVFCSRAFTGLADLAGRKVRTSSVGQSELMAAIGAIPVITPFAETVSALRTGVADCAITGTLSGYEIGLPAVASHVHGMAISWGLSVFGANGTFWRNLPAEVRAILRREVAVLEERIWAQADADTRRGLACNTGSADCPGAPARPMSLVEASAADEELRKRLLATVVLPRWIGRCGESCVGAWNSTLRSLHSIEASEGDGSAPSRPSR